MLRDAGLPFQLVVEPQDVAAYTARWGNNSVLELPESGRGIAFSRSWIKRHSEALGEPRIWMLDDDVKKFGRRDPNADVTPVEALSWAEDFCDAFANVGILGISGAQWPCDVPVIVNRMAYTVVLVKNGTPFYWRPGVIDDSDFTLQVLAGGMATLLIKGYRHHALPNAAGAEGGNTDSDYYEKHQHLVEELARTWPGVVSVAKGPSGRPQARIRWGAFDPPLEPSGKPNPTESASGLRAPSAPTAHASQPSLF
jgi:hypothetical protein